MIHFILYWVIGRDRPDSDQTIMIMNNEVYLVTKDLELIKLIREALEPPGYSVITIEGLRVFSLFPDTYKRVILIDSSAIDYSELSEDLLRNDFALFISDRKEKRRVLEVLEKGGYGYIEKPLDTEELIILINRLAGIPEKDEIIPSSKIKKVLREIKRFSGNNLPVLISGEDGIDLEYYARILHQRRDRKGSFFLPLKSISEAKIQSIIRDLKEISDGLEKSSIFLDDVCDFDREAVREIAGIAEKRDIFLIGGTRLGHDDIPAEKKEVISKLFDKREIVIPPLRERREDIPEMIKTLLRKMERQFKMGEKNISASARSYLLKYHWPGNDREIEQIIKKAYILSEGKTIEKRDLFLGDMSLCPLEEFLSSRLKGLIKENSNLYPAVMGEVEKALISIVLQKVESNQLKASRILGINRNTLRAKIKEYNLNKFRISQNKVSSKNEESTG